MFVVTSTYCDHYRNNDQTVRQIFSNKIFADYYCSIYNKSDGYQHSVIEIKQNNEEEKLMKSKDFIRFANDRLVKINELKKETIRNNEDQMVLFNIEEMNIRKLL